MADRMRILERKKMCKKEGRDGGKRGKISYSKKGEKWGGKGIEDLEGMQRRWEEEEEERGTRR
jgi:hypothetical protein